MPLDQQAVVSQGRRTVARFAGGQRLPTLGAGFFVEGDDDGSRAADEANQSIMVDERRTGETPERKPLS